MPLTNTELLIPSPSRDQQTVGQTRIPDIVPRCPGSHWSFNAVNKRLPPISSSCEQLLILVGGKRVLEAVAFLQSDVISVGQPRLIEVRFKSHSDIVYARRAIELVWAAIHGHFQLDVRHVNHNSKRGTDAMLFVRKARNIARSVTPFANRASTAVLQSSTSHKTSFTLPASRQELPSSTSHGEKPSSNAHKGSGRPASHRMA